MCLTLHKAAFILHFATHPIEVYKVVTIEDRSFPLAYQYQDGKQEESKFSMKGRQIAPAIGGEKLFLDIPPTIDIDDGIHFYTTKDVAFQHTFSRTYYHRGHVMKGIALKVVKCIIPENGVYFIDDAQEEGVTNTLIYYSKPQILSD